MKAEGGCLCGLVRYSIEADLIDAGFCHCTLCQRSSGAPVLAWLTIPLSGFMYTEGDVGRYASSADHEREFCPGCGTQIAFRATLDPKTIDITLCSLDDNIRVAPRYHIWWQSKVAWLQTDDNLPRYMDAGPDSNHEN